MATNYYYRLFIAVVKYYLEPLAPLCYFIGMERKNDIIESQLMSRKQVLEYLKISPATLTKLMKSRAFPFIKFEKSRRGKVLFKKSDIDAFLESKIVR